MFESTRITGRSVGTIAALDLVEHLVDRGGPGELVAVARRGWPRVSWRVGPGARGGAFAESPADPLGGRQPLAPREALDRASSVSSSRTCSRLVM